MEGKNSDVVAKVLLENAVTSVGKRSMLKAITEKFGPYFERVYGKKPREKRTVNPEEIPEETRCVARVKGGLTGERISYYTFHFAERCVRHRVDGSDLCKIHGNQHAKLGELLYGRVGEVLNEEQKKVFGDIDVGLECAGDDDEHRDQ